jgi:hypothetical protein
MPPIPMPPVPNITSAVEDAVAYPILTKDVSSSVPSSGSSGGVANGGGQSLDVKAQNTIRQALGWRYRTDDTKGFVAALNKAFVLKDVEGHTEWNYQPQSYSVQADMGEITGAQASIYARAKNALDQTLPLLDGLTPLLPDPDYDDIEAMRTIVRDELNQLVGEFGQVAGPRVQRVDSIFKLLIGPKAHYHNPVNVQGHIGQLGDRLGMKRRLVNTIEDEQDLTNFLILVDYVNSLYQTWGAQRDFFSRGKHGQPFLGTQLVLISQALASIVDQVQDAYDALDSVYLGAAERQTTILNFFGEFAPITLAELLSWVQDFATNEGPQLLQDAGKDGVVAFRSTINRLQYLLSLTVQLSRGGGSNPARGFHTYRVQVALADVCQSLRLVDRESDKIRRTAVDDDPALTAEGALFSLDSLVSVIPVGSSGPFLLTVGGMNIKPGARMMLISTQKPADGYQGTVPPPTVPTQKALSSVYNPTQLASLSEGVTVDGNFITASFNLPTPLTITYTIAVINSDGAYAWLENALSSADLNSHPAYTAVPRVDSVSVSKARSGGKTIYRLSIKGGNFEPEAYCTISHTARSSVTVVPYQISSEELDIALTSTGAGQYAIPTTESASLSSLVIGTTYNITVYNGKGGAAQSSGPVQFTLS